MKNTSLLGKVTERDVLDVPGAAAFYRRLQTNRNTVELVELVPALAGPTDEEIRHFTTVRRPDEIQRLVTSLIDHAIVMDRHMDAMKKHLQRIKDSDMLKDKGPDVLRPYLIYRQKSAGLRHHDNRLQWRQLWWDFIAEVRKIRMPSIITRSELPYVPSLTDPGRRPSKPVPGWSMGRFSISGKDPFAVL